MTDSRFGSPISRRTLFRTTAALLTAGVATQALPQAAAAPGPLLGTVIDYAAGVPSAQSIKNAGHLGAVRYVSQRRPGTENWMIGKPVTARETNAMAALGLQTASVYQFGKAGSADWMNGLLGVAEHAPQAIALHKAAGGPTGRPIYVAIDDNPTHAQYTRQIRPYLQGFRTALAVAGYQMGIYGNYSTIDWAINDGLGEYFWMHNWGSNGRIHPRTTLHQIRIDKDTVGGVGVDINNVYASDWGQWTPGSSHHPGNSSPGSNTNPGETISINGSSLPSADQVQQATDLLNALSSQR